MPHKQHLTIYSDGGISPIAAGAAVVVTNSDGAIVSLANKTLPTMTNNEAEYASLIMALEAASRLQASSVEMCMDSEVVIYQMAGRFAVNSSRLKPWHRKACVLARAIPELTYRHIPRTENQLADALASEAIAGREWHLSVP